MAVPTPADVVPSHRRVAWVVFIGLLGGFLAYCIVITVQAVHSRSNPPVYFTFDPVTPVVLNNLSVCISNYPAPGATTPTQLRNVVVSCNLTGVLSGPPTSQAQQGTFNLSAPPGPAPVQFFNATTFTVLPGSNCPVLSTWAVFGQDGAPAPYPYPCFKFPLILYTFNSTAAYIQASLFFDSGPDSVTGPLQLFTFFLDASGRAGDYNSFFYTPLNQWTNVQLTSFRRVKLNGSEIRRVYSETYPVAVVRPNDTSLPPYGRTWAAQLAARIDLRGTQIIREKDPTSFTTLVGNYGGFLNWITALFGIVFGACIGPTMALRRPFEMFGVVKAAPQVSVVRELVTLQTARTSSLSHAPSASLPAKPFLETGLPRSSDKASTHPTDSAA